MSNVNDMLLEVGDESVIKEQMDLIRRLGDYKITDAKRVASFLKNINAESNLAALQEQLKNTDLSEQERTRIYKKHQSIINANAQKAAEANARYEESLFKQSLSRQRQEYMNSIKQTEQRKRKSIQEQYAQEYALIKANVKAGENAYQKLSALTRKRNKEMIDSYQEEQRMIKALYEDKTKQLEKEKQQKKDINKTNNASIGGILNNISRMPDGLANAQKAAHEKADASKEQVDALRQQYLDAQQSLEESDSEEAKEFLKQLEQSITEANAQAVKDANQAALADMKKAAVDTAKADYEKNYQQAVTILSDYKGVIDGRLQGSDKSFNSTQEKISSNLALSPFVKTTKVMETLKQAVDAGIVYNVEQRAFLASISEKIANTFDAFDSNLMRIVRLQQADSTVARLGMEAALTKFLNSNFEDNSYLKNVADTVTANLVDASSQLTRDAAAEFEFIVQKWLGSLSSVGLSDDTVGTLAKGLNYLATGDVTSLANSTSLQTLFAMSASNANLEYSEILLHGLNADNTNKLLNSMVLYLKDIAENSDNQVVKAAYGDIFEMSLSDMKAISNLSVGDISNIAGTSMSYSQMTSETNKQMLQLLTRTSLAQMLDNVYNNALYGVAEDMASNPVMYLLDKTIKFMDSVGADINIPFINAMGFGLDLNTSVKGLMKMGLGLGQAFSLAGNIASALGSGGGLNLDAWGASETTKRGVGMSLGSGSTLGGVSGSMGTFAQNGNSDDAANSSMSSATDDAEDSKKITNKNQEQPEKTLDDFFEAVVGKNATDFIKICDDTLLLAYEDNGKYLRVHDEGMIIAEGNLQVVDVPLNKTVSAELLAIKLLLSKQSDFGNIVKLAEGSVVTVDSAQLKQVMTEVIYGDTETSVGATLKSIKEGGIEVTAISGSVEVKNAPGEKLQVSNLIW